jgi:hypothetical protein
MDGDKGKDFNRRSGLIVGGQPFFSFLRDER